MTPNELLAHEPIDVFKSDGHNNAMVFGLLKNNEVDHLPEIPLDGFLWDETLAGLDNRLMVKIHSFGIGHSTGVLYYTHIPIMIFAFNGTVDEKGFRWVLDVPQFNAMIQHLESLIASVMPARIAGVDMDKNIPELQV